MIGFAADVLHHEVRPALRCGPASKTRAMFGWSISASACRSASKRAMTCAVSMPALMTLSATCRRTGSRLLGEPDLAHPAFADALEEAVGARWFRWMGVSRGTPALAQGPTNLRVFNQTGHSGTSQKGETDDSRLLGEMRILATGLK